VGQKRDVGKYPKTWDSNYESYPGRIYSQYQNTTLHTPLEQACLFTLASMARLGCTSASRSTVFYSIDDILHTSHDVCIFLNSIGALKDRSTIRIGFILGELHNRYSTNSSNYITALPLSMLHINVLLPPHFSMMRIDEASLIVQGANTSYCNCRPPVHRGANRISFLNRRSGVGRARMDLHSDNDTKTNEDIRA
jgi:hypothetical protein